VLNDYSLGSLFGGRTGFEKQLQNQGFADVPNIPTEEELNYIKQNNNLAKWTGPWLTEYPWERASQ
jgi:hypothetical protein